MDKRTYRLGVAALGALIAAIVAYAVHSQPPEHLQSAGAQTQIWSAVPRWRSFAAFHGLFLGVIGFAYGAVATYRFLPSGAYSLALGSLGLLGYFGLEPRASSAEYPLIAQLLTILATGFAAARWLRVGASSQGAISWFAYLLPATALIGLAQLARKLEAVPPVSATVAQELLLSVLYAFSGLLSGLALWGPARPHFTEAKPLPAKGRTSRTVFQALLLVSFICSFISFMVIDRSQPTMREWVLIAPLVPVVMAFYAPYTWLFSDAPSAVFSPDAAPSAQQMRFFMGVFFEYLSVGTAVAIYQALRYPTSTMRLVVAQVLIVIYWAPSIWLLLTMGSFAAGMPR